MAVETKCSQTMMMKPPKDTLNQHDSGRRSPARWALLLALAILGACSESAILDPDPDPDPDSLPARLVTITVSPVPDPLSSVGATVALAAVGEYDDGTADTLSGVAWSSTDESVGTIDDQGVFTAVGAGEAEAVALLDDVEGRTTVRVEDEEELVGSLRVTSPGDTAFSFGVRMRFDATVLDEDGRPIDGEGPTIVWSSQDPAVATVDDEGRVTPVSEGTTMIVAESGGLRGERTLHVDGRNPVTIDLARAEALQWALEDSVSTWGYPGAVAAVSFPNGAVWRGAAGQSRPNRQMSPELGAYFASVTKTLIGAVIHQMVAESRLAYDDPIGDFLPTREHIAPGITVEQLLGHTSGLFDYVADGGVFDQEDLLADPDRLFTPGEILASLLGPPRQAAGVSTDYSNTNMVALGEIIEVISGRPFYAEVRRRLLEPLGLSDTYFPAWEDDSNEQMTGYLSDGSDGSAIEVPSVESFAGATGGMVSTVTDMAQWSRLLFAEDVVSTTAAERLRAAASVDVSDLGEFDIEFRGIGQGARSTRFSDIAFVGHEGTFPHTRSAIAHSDDLDLSVAIALNQNDVERAIENRLSALLLRVASAPTGSAVER